MAIVIVLAATSCKQSAVEKKLSGCDSLQINFNDKSVATTEKTAIKKLVGFLDGKKTEQFKCGYDGKLLFYKDNAVLMDVDFKFTEPGCMHFLYTMEGQLISTKLNGEAADLLESLQKGRLWY
ncbi:MAG TPA: hypothetical protein VLJ68_09020 [Chitinophagaceae bacterium]|nr:hypothetical protein [Chitinophagaceae bacterium]